MSRKPVTWHHKAPGDAADGDADDKNDSNGCKDGDGSSDKLVRMLIGMNS